MTDHERFSIFFLLTAKLQIIGIASLMLRARTVDAFASSRLSIEATAFAHRIWKNPHLLQIYFNGYPNVDKTELCHKAWQPSKEYKKEFSTNKIFSEMGDVGENLQLYYAIICMKASHPSPAHLLNIRRHNGQISLFSFETDTEEWGRNWGLLLAVSFLSLKVFLRILREGVEPAMIRTLEDEIINWRDNTLRTLQYPPTVPRTDTHNIFSEHF